MDQQDLFDLSEFMNSDDMFQVSIYTLYYTTCLKVKIKSKGEVEITNGIRKFKKNYESVGLCSTKGCK
jgi:hypothetical protein